MSSKVPFGQVKQGILTIDALVVNALDTEGFPDLDHVYSMIKCYIYVFTYLLLTVKHLLKRKRLVGSTFAFWTNATVSSLALFPVYETTS